MVSRLTTIIAMIAIPNELFELASKQCLEGLKLQNINYVLCPALPSKYTAKSAAKLIIELIDNYLEKGEK